MELVLSNIVINSPVPFLRTGGPWNSQREVPHKKTKVATWSGYHSTIVATDFALLKLNDGELCLTFQRYEMHLPKARKIVLAGEKCRVDSLNAG